MAWTKYTYHHLVTGTRVRFSPHARRLGGKTGIVDRLARTKYSILVDGIFWKVPPGVIAAFQDGTDDDLQALMDAKKTPEVKMPGESGWDDDDVQVGNVVIFHRGLGSYDIARVERMTPQGKPYCKLLNGRGRGKVYGFQKSWYVCKLPADRFME